MIACFKDDRPLYVFMNAWDETEVDIVLKICGVMPVVEMMNGITATFFCFQSVLTYVANSLYFAIFSLHFV